MPNETATIGRLFRPVRKRRAFEEISQQIRELVRTGNLGAGDKLPPERELAQQFQVGRSSVREALRALEIAGVVTLQTGAHGGAVIQKGTPEPLMRTMHDLLLLGGVSLQDFTEARVCLQREVVRLACERATEEDFLALEDNVAKTSRIGTPDRASERTELTIEFYALLAKATRNEVICALMAAVTEPLRDYIAKLGPDPSWDVAAARAQFLVRLRARDADGAIDEMVSHMRRLHRHLLRKLQQDRA